MLELDQPSSENEITAAISNRRSPAIPVGWNNLVFLLASTVCLFSLNEMPWIRDVVDTTSPLCKLLPLLWRYRFYSFPEIPGFPKVG